MTTRDTYQVQEWEDLPSENTPVSAARLGHMEQGISDAMDNRALKEIYGDNFISLGRQQGTPVGEKSVAVGESTIASGENSYAEGYLTYAIGNNSHAEGRGTRAAGDNQHVSGKYNVTDTKNKYAEIVGGGESYAAKNIRTLDWQGNAVYAGDVTNGQGISLNGLKEMIDNIMEIIQPSEPDEEGGETT